MKTSFIVWNGILLTIGFIALLEGIVVNMGVGSVEAAVGMFLFFCSFTSLGVENLREENNRLRQKLAQQSEAGVQ